MSAEPSQPEPLARLVADFRIRMRCERTEERPLWAPDGYDGTAYRVTLGLDSRSMTVDYFQGPAISRDPRAMDVLDCLLSEASAIDNARDFADWCREFGLDTDSRRAEGTYRAATKQTVELKRLLGDHYDRFLAAERL